jgi:hypothetical protein
VPLKRSGAAGNGLGTTTKNYRSGAAGYGLGITAKYSELRASA